MSEDVIVEFLLDKIQTHQQTPKVLHEDSIVNIKIRNGFQYIELPMFFENQFKIVSNLANELNRLIDFLKKNPGLEIEIRGFSDVGFINKNQKELAAKRAVAVKKYLTSKGVKNKLNAIPFPTKLSEINRINELNYRYSHFIELRVKGSISKESLLRQELKEELLAGSFISSATIIEEYYEDDLRKFNDHSVQNKIAQEIEPEDNNRKAIENLIDQQIEEDLAEAEKEFENNLDRSINGVNDESDIEIDDEEDISFDDLRELHEEELVEEDYFNPDENSSENILDNSNDDFDFDKAMLTDEKIEELVLTSPPKFELGGGLAFNLFYGDISRSIIPIIDARPHFSIDIVKPISQMLKIKAQAGMGYISGSNKSINVGGDSPQGVFFTTGIYDISIQFQFNITKLLMDNHNSFTDKFQIFAGIGHGVVGFNTTLKMKHTDQYLLQYQKGASGQTSEMITPISIEVNHSINHNINLAYTLCMKGVNTDKLDGWVETGSSRDRYIQLSVSCFYKLREKYFVKTMQSIQPDGFRTFFLHAQGVVYA